MNHKNGHEPFAAFALSVCIFLAICILRGIVPFGDKSFLQIDLYHQYAPFYEEMRSRILAGQSLEFSLEGSLGKEFLVQWAYMNSSLVGFLILLFPAEKLPEAIHLMMALKISLACASFCWYLKKSHSMEGLPVIAFALYYGWCGFVTCYFWNIMWLDAVALFPLLIFGIDRMIEKRKTGLYLAALALTIYSNFYIAFLVCVVITLYFVLQVGIRFLKEKSWKNMVLSCTLFAGNSILAALFTMFLILPTMIALSQTAVSGSLFPAFQIYDNVWQLLSAHLIGARPVVLGRNEDLPNLFSGTLTIFLIPLYFVSRNIPRGKKLKGGILILFFWLCSVIQPLDFLIHGLHFPANLPHRFTFMYSFFLIGMAAEVWQKREQCQRKLEGLILGSIGLVVWISEFVIVPRIYELDRIYSDKDLMLSAVLLCLYAWIWHQSVGQRRESENTHSERQGSVRGKTKVTVGGLILLFVTAECLYSGYDGMSRVTQADEFSKYMEAASEVKTYLNEKEQGEFYRMEFRRFVAINNGALYHYPGVSQFSSLAPGGISAMMTNLGFAGAGNSYRYYDPTPLLDAILNVKYVVNRDDEGTPTTLGEHYNLEKQIGNLWVFQNPQVLPVGFMVSEDLTGWEPETQNPFENQNRLARLASGEDRVLLDSFNWDHMEYENITLTEMKGDSVSYTVEEPRNLNRIPRVTITLISPKRQYLYLYVNEENAKRVVYTTGKERQDREIAAGNGLIDIGWVDEGESIEVSLELTNRGEFEKAYHENGRAVVQAAGFDLDAWNEIYAKLSSRPWKLTSWSDTMLEGRVQAEENQILFTSIPYMKGWSAYVDGEKTDLVPLCGLGVIGVPVTPGEHVVRLTFAAPGLRTGLLVSLLSFAEYGAWLLIKKRWKNQVL